MELDKESNRCEVIRILIGPALRTLPRNSLLYAKKALNRQPLSEEWP